MGANLKIEDLHDLTRRRMNLYCECGICGRSSTVDAAAMARLYGLHMFSTRWHQLHQHLRCRRCGGRPALLKPSFAPPTAPNRFPKDEAGWRRLHRALRG